jgi:hypothetical protein
MFKTMRPLAILLVLASPLAIGGRASAQNSDAPTNIDCSAFTKQPNGNWHVGTQTTVAIAHNRLTLADRDIARGQVVSNDVDLYQVLERQCTKRK